MTKIETELQGSLQLRYGAATPEIQGEANPVLARILAHKSVRRFAPAPLPPSALEKIVAGAQSAATSSNLQTWSVIAIQEPSHKDAVATLCGNQEFIRRAPLFLVFCADLARLSAVSEREGLAGEGLDYFEMFIMATVDASLAAQNAALTAESLGLGICYVGAARNHSRELATALNLPPKAFALFGMAIGVPAEGDTSAVKPRLPQAEALHLETYGADAQEENVAEYNAIMKEFYESQNMKVGGDWSLHSAQRVQNVQALTGREVLREVLIERGFGLK